MFKPIFQNFSGILLGYIVSNVAWHLVAASLALDLPGMRGRFVTWTRFAADKILRDACIRVGLEGVSTHSFRRAALTMMSSAGIPLRVIQEILGHNDLGTLQR